MKLYDGSDIWLCSILGFITGSAFVGIVWLLISQLSCTLQEEQKAGQELFIPASITHNKMLCTYENSFTKYHEISASYRCADSSLLIKIFKVDK